MNKKRKLLLEFAGFLLAILIIFSLLWVVFPKAENRFNEQGKPVQNKTLNYTALGDSLTEGVGDATNQGGFVPLLSKRIENVKQTTVNTKNFGKSGDTSVQIYDRMIKQKDILEEVKKADFITITVGGNDVMKVIRDNFTKLSDMTSKDFLKPQEDYQNQLKTIFSKLRSVNTSAQIYVLGIYNPFYINFPEITEMQKVIDNWNEATQEVVQSENKAYFVPINELLYKGLDGKQAIEDSGKNSEAESQNNLLYTGDNFHPNNNGYQIMADAVFSKYHEVNP